MQLLMINEPTRDLGLTNVCVLSPTVLNPSLRPLALTSLHVHVRVCKKNQFALMIRILG